MDLTLETLARLEATPPPSWYLLARAEEVPRQRPLAREPWGEPLVVFRAAEGLAAVGGRCPHMGAALANGCIERGLLRCPFHAWKFGSDGACVRVPGLAQAPGFAQLPAWPLRERHGLLHVFRGERPAFPLPFFDDVAVDEVVAGRPFSLRVGCPWWMVGANGFDAQHFANVHGRTPREQPRLEHPHPDACRVTYRFEITGHALQDRISRRLWGAHAELSFTSWGGNVIVGRMTIGRFVSRLLVFVRGTSPGACAVDFVVFRPRRRSWRRPWQRLELEAVRAVTRSFFRHEVDSLGDVQLDPRRLVAPDHLLRGYLEWLVALGSPRGDRQPQPAAAEV